MKKTHEITIVNNFIHLFIYITKSLICVLSNLTENKLSQPVSKGGAAGRGHCDLARLHVLHKTCIS